jgi:hypothetical protein
MEWLEEFNRQRRVDKTWEIDHLMGNLRYVSQYVQECTELQAQGVLPDFRSADRSVHIMCLLRGFLEDLINPNMIDDLVWPNAGLPRESP